MAAQPGIDRALSGTGLDRNASGTAQSSYDLFLSSENLDQQGFTVLHLIVLGLQCLDLETVLKSHSNDVDVRDANGRTPLLWAAWRGDVRSINHLIKYGADVNGIDYQSWTPLARAAKAGHLSTVRCLLKAQASTTIATSQGFQPIHHASDNKLQGVAVVRELLACGADPSVSSTSHGTPLHNAANRGSVETIKLLLSHGSNINAVDGDGDTPVMIALLCWNEAAFLYLAKAGARLDIARRNGHSVVHVAVWGSSLKVWELLTNYAESGQVYGIDVSVQHNNHDINVCFDKCRGVWYTGPRDIEAELVAFRRMVDAFTPSMGFQPCRPNPP